MLLLRLLRKYQVLKALAAAPLLCICLVVSIVNIADLMKQHNKQENQLHTIQRIQQKINILKSKVSNNNS